MSDLTTFRDHARSRSQWAPGDLRAPCATSTAFGTPKAPDHANCGGCGCLCHEPTPRERQMWTVLADEIDSYLGSDESGDERLFEVPYTDPLKVGDHIRLRDSDGTVIGDGVVETPGTPWGFEKAEGDS